MERKVRCPICDKEIVEEYWTECYGVCESRIHCNRCGYGEQFAYGNYLIEVGNKCFMWSWNETVDNRKIKRAMFMARRNWKKHKKKTNNFYF